MGSSGAVVGDGCDDVGVVVGGAGSGVGGAVAGSVVGGVAAGGGGVESVADAQASLRRGFEATGSGLVRPDWVSASVTARASGRRVEVLAERSETSRTFALPEGGAIVDQYLAGVRFRDRSARATDGWRDIDTSLVADAAGVVRPKAVENPK